MLRFVILTFLAVSIVGVVFYVLQGRAWLKSKPWAQGFFDFMEPIEVALFKKSETILFARMKQFTGVLLTFLTQVGAVDITPLMPLVPEKYQGVITVAWNLLPLTITGMGIMDEYLRRNTTKPLEIVAIPDKGMTPEVAKAIEKVEVANEAAVAKVEVAKEASTV